MSESDKNPTASRSFEPYGASNEERTNPIDTQGAQARVPGEPMQPSSISGEPRTLIPNAQPIRDPLLETDPLRVPPRQGPANPLSIGRSDLDPFQFDPTGSGGMIFDPFRNMQHQRDIPRNLPPGAVPPGARFDPFGPPNPDDLTPGSIGPNPSHLRKPDFGDDLGGGFGRGRGGFGGGGFGGGFGGGGFL